MKYFCALILVVLGGCGGNAGSLEAAQPSPAQDPSMQTYRLSGQVRVREAIQLDGDINDSRSSKIANDDPLQAQSIFSQGTLQGFADYTADAADYYQATLQAGQVVRLEVSDSAQGDLDLYLLNSQAQQVQASQLTGSSGKLEQLTVASSGDYLIYVSAAAGKSKYVLQLLPSSHTTAQRPAQFVLHEAIVKYKARSALARGGQDHGAVKVALPSAAALARSASPFAALGSSLAAQMQTMLSIKALSLQEDVEYAEPNYWRQALAEPNDPLFSQQWNYTQINLPQAWDISTGTSMLAPVVVAVLDTGVLVVHEDLRQQWVDGYDFISDISNAADGTGIDNNPDDPGDKSNVAASSWHGTHVAGIVAAESNNHLGVSGVSWGAKLMPLRVLGRQGGTSYDIAQAVRYAAGLANDSGTVPSQRADIINMSFGSAGQSETERQALAAAVNAGVVVVAASGNDGTQADFYPAADANVIAVGATQLGGSRAPYSNYGSHLAVAAPGGNTPGIFSTYVNYSFQRYSGYAELVGTSMATPHVAGVFALMKAVNPSLTPAALRAAISSCSITKRRGQCSHDQYLGYGEIDAYLALQYAQGGGMDGAWLASSASLLRFTRSGSATLQLSNYGNAEATAISVTSSATWLSAAVEPIQTSLSANAQMNVHVMVNAAGLAAQDHVASLTVHYQNAGQPKTLVISVQLQLSKEISSTFAPLYILLEDVACSGVNSANNSCYKTVEASAEGAFSIDNVAAGQYALYASTDIDGNDVLCEAGELCGSYPQLGAMQVQSALEGLDLIISLKTESSEVQSLPAKPKRFLTTN